MAATVSPSPTARLPQLAKYEVLEEIGHGGMATVYRAKDPRLGREVAVKLIHRHLRDSGEVAARFTTEAHAVAKLRHPNIVEVFDVSADDDDERYLVVELIRGQTLRALLKERGALPPEVAAALAIELLAALAHAHAEGIVHRDVKPENVLLEIGEGDETAKVKLTDFGIAKLLDEKGVTSTGQVLGSPAHMAPEQIEGGAVDARSDVFGMGVLLYECMVGHLPFEGNNPAQVLRRVLDGQYPQADLELPIVGKKYSLILDQALAHVQDERWASAQAMKEALTAELKRVGITDAKAELASFLKAPDDYAPAHEKRMVDKLVALGAAARKDQRVLDAAADYNRALAYAPTDPALLKIVSGMHKAEARARTIKRVAPLVGGAVVACLLAFGLAKWLQKPAPITGPETPTTSASAVTSGSAAASASAVPSASASVAVVPPASASVAVVASVPSTARTAVVPPPALDAATAVAASRTITFGEVRPAAGVSVTIDADGMAHDLSVERSITVDGNAHQLHFTCAKNACEELTQNIAPGTSDQSIPRIELKIRPATLFVDGNPNDTYNLPDLPQVAVAAGKATQIPMTQGTLVVVVQDATLQKQKSVSVFAGQTTRVSF